ncbi:MAG: hypothetical protein AAF721_32010 [Myxococcota bacterium]
MPKTLVSELTTVVLTDEPTPPAADKPAPVVRQRPSRELDPHARGKGRRKSQRAKGSARRFNPSSRFRG